MENEIIIIAEDSYSWCESEYDWIEWNFLEQMGIETEIYED